MAKDDIPGLDQCLDQLKGFLPNQRFTSMDQVEYARQVERQVADVRIGPMNMLQQKIMEAQYLNSSVDRKILYMQEYECSFESGPVNAAGQEPKKEVHNLNPKLLLTKRK